MKKITAFLISVMMVAALAVPVFAEGAYMDSITAKPAPEIVGDGDVIGDIIEDGEDVGDIGEGDLIITPFVDKDELDDEPRSNMEDAFEQIKSGNAEYPPEMEEILGGEPVAKDLFDVDVIDDELLKELEEGKEIRFTLDVNIGAGELVAVACFVDGQWIMAAEAINNGDGTITVTLSKIGTIGVFVKGEDKVEPTVTPEPGEPTGGDAGEGVCILCHGFFPYLGAAPFISGLCIICFVIIVVVIATIAYIIYRNTKKDEEEKKN